MKSKGSNLDAIHYFFLLFASIQLVGAAWAFLKNGFNFTLESIITTSDDFDVSFLAIYLGLFGIAYVLLLCSILLVAAYNLSRS